MKNKRAIYNLQTGETTIEEYDAPDYPEEPKWEALRLERDSRLSQTDTYALSDRTLSDEMRTYRQQLRDLPANTSDPTNPTWPTKPS
tara:strand:- start:70 stop:330 length:261 start_codon:yes stop_codon:yes gene_type:complete